ncbi:hypothetical protein FRACYDRAFT_241188 [Fragilariopsis cylindrus CCMP1102]|uniref:NTF2 domain-containing protein n=1 Tax=Fragilariopsis cylindrus CCMP1102 TaxID=635003 RepID=A0A1E7F9E5_9STRA|nr:hypothetical protein FRACYDRAFT_241188 [Fragilariopsis cylindrus CCMP1102]|eukprot:OEU14635.1 hypothetical protein FRACYDRAFT_241188 [Fragilariopsis cylindrus CCMP1102]
MSETTATPSPPPPSSDVAAAGTALKVGIAFVKQYYKILSTQPEMVERFYAAPDVDLSYLSHGEGSEPTSPVPLEEYKKSNDKGDHLSTERWGCGNNEKMLFELEDGAIDAQPSTNDGILLVVTACVIFKGSISEDGDGGDTKRRKKFVQTFFLAKFGRNFSVINDILRFLVAEPSSVVIAADSTFAATVSPVNVDSSAAAATAMKNTVDDVAVETKEKKIDAATKSKATTETTEKSSSSASKEETPKSSDDAAAAVDEAPGGGVEETKEEAPDEEEVAAEKATTPTKKTTATKDGKSKKNKSGSNNKSQQQQQPQSPQPAAAKPAPGSWASLVVSGGSAPNTPSRKAPAAAKDKAKLPLPLVVDSKEKDTKENGTSAGIEAEKSKTATTSKNNSGGGGGGSSKKADLKSKEQQQQQNRSKRDPDNTLVIKNLSDNVKEHDIINMFQPFAVATKSRIVGTNLNHHRNLAFVDYDCVAPVNAALKKHAETPFEWNGKVLEVDQKTLEQRARRKAGLSFNNNSNNGYRTGGGSGGGGSGKTGSNSGGGGDQKDKRSGDRDRDRRRSRGNRAGTGAK